MNATQFLLIANGHLSQHGIDPVTATFKSYSQGYALDGVKVTNTVTECRGESVSDYVASAETRVHTAKIKAEGDEPSHSRPLECSVSQMRGLYGLPATDETVMQEKADKSQQDALATISHATKLAAKRLARRDARDAAKLAVETAGE